MARTTTHSCIAGPSGRTGCDENNDQDRRISMKVSCVPHCTLSLIRGVDVTVSEDPVLSRVCLQQSMSVGDQRLS